MPISSMTRIFYQSARFGLAILTLVGIASSCSRSVQDCWEGERYFDSTGALDLNRIQGKFVQGRYYDPLNFFSIPVPSYQELIIQECVEPSKNKSAVLFVDVPIFVSQKVAVESLSSTDHLELFQDEPQAAAKILQGIFDDGTLPPHFPRKL